MEILLLITALVFVILGIIGSFLPVIPGPITSWVGLLILHLTNTVPINKSFLIVTFAVALLVWVLDYIIPAIGTKRFGGSKYGVIGTSLGLIIGLIAPIPGGIIIGPFLGAFVGELVYQNNSERALKAAFGSFIGFLTSTFIKFIVAIVYFGFFISIAWNYKSLWM